MGKKNGKAARNGNPAAVAEASGVRAGGGGRGGDEDAVQQQQFEDASYPYDERMNGKEYEELLTPLQIELVKAQRWVKDTKQRVLIILEGRDAAGKGGTIKTITEHLNPRGARVVALLKPNETERGQWYFQRYVNHLPSTGEIVLFDRSWYNRAGVELVMGFCTPNEYLEFTRQAPGMERSLIQSGIRLFKIWLAVGRKEQLRRLEARRKDPLKQWKLSPMDLESINKWDDYTAARDRMFYYTHTPEAPWTVVRSDDKKRARLNIMRFILSNLPYTDKDAEIVATPDPKIVGAAAAIVPQDDAFLFGRAWKKNAKA
jgi:polyphosphate kinase 2